MKKIFDSLPSGIERFLCGSLDEFLNEGSSLGLKRLQRICNFTGSSGIAVIEKSGKSAFFTDGRYKVQASLELNLDDFDLFNIADLIKYLQNKNGLTSLEIKFHSVAFISGLEQEGIKLNFIEEELTTSVFNLSNEEKQSAFREFYNFNLAGETPEEKFEKVFSVLDREKCEGIFIFNPTQVCWLFNIRGKSLEYTPIVNRFAFVSRETKILLSFDELTKIQCDNLLVLPHISLYIYKKLKALCKNVILYKEDHIENWKSIKTSFEIECIRKAHIEDGKAVREFIKWIKFASMEEETEYSIGKQLLEMRKKRTGFICESFPCIVAFQENSAIIHYRAIKGKDKKISNGILLVDSGGQYYDEQNKICGTTDVTRVIFLGEPDGFHKRMYTLVLKGNLALSSAIFPEGATGSSLDILARQFLFKEGYDYGHGTGHGVGYFLSVHEGPCGISKNCHIPLREGMIISNEPGVYLEGQFGIRIENLLLVTKVPNMNGFLQFEILTQIEVEKKLLDYEILTDEELGKLALYHKSLKEN